MPMFAAGPFPPSSPSDPSSPSEPSHPSSPSVPSDPSLPSEPSEPSPPSLGPPLHPARPMRPAALAALMNRRRSKSDAISYVTPSERGINSPFPPRRGSTFVRRAGRIRPESAIDHRISIHESEFPTVVNG